jgi:hypothetical protein
MAYEGLDAPEVAVVAALTHIRSRPWLEQMVARATRVDPHAGPYQDQSALVFHPDDPLFARFRQQVERDQNTAVRLTRRKGPSEMPEWLQEKLANWERADDRGIVPLESNAIGLRFATLRPGRAYARARPEHETAPTQQADPPSVAERRLRAHIGEMVAAQTVEDQAELRVPHGRDLYHRYNAVLKRVFGNRGRAEMTLPELEAVLSWLDRNRLSDHLHLIEGDERYAQTTLPRRSADPQRPIASLR